MTTTDAEAIARIIDPKAWTADLGIYDDAQYWHDRRRTAVEHATAILSYLASRREAEPVAWMHPIAGWTSVDYGKVLMHCEMDGPKPIPLYTAPQSPVPAPAGKDALDAETIQILLDLLNPLHGSLDRQMYVDKPNPDLDPHPDDETDVVVTAQMERDLTQAVCILENRKRQVAKVAPAGDLGARLKRLEIEATDLGYELVPERSPDAIGEVERLRKALSYYANPEIYKPHPHGPAFDRRDLSGVAIAALNGGRGDE